MKIQKNILCAVAAFVTFAAGASLVTTIRFINSLFAAKPIEAKVSSAINPILKPSPENKPTVVADSEESPFFILEEGFYYILGDNYGKFEEFDLFDFYSTTSEAAEAGGSNEKRISYEGWFHLSGDRSLEFKTLKIKDKKISFVTETRKGVRYEFEGRFFEGEEKEYKTRDGGGIYYAAPVLKGRLSKWRNGVKIAENTFKFGFTVGC